MKNKAPIIVVFLVLAVLSQSVKVIPEGRTGVIFNLKGGVQENALAEGIHFLIPFVQTLIIFDTRIITYSFSNSAEDETRLGEPIVAKTKDGQIVGIETSIVTQMIKSQAPQVYQTLRTDYQPVLKSKIGKVMQEIIAGHVADALYTEETRKIVTTELLEYLSGSFKQSGFELKDVFLRKIEFSQEYIDAIERKQIALQKAQLAQIQKEIAVKEKQIEIIRGEAIAQQVEIKGNAIHGNPSVAELEYLDMIEHSEKKVPVIMGLKGNTLINLDKLLQQN
ncbi:MAG: prohibitin family protein [Cyanobacteria bacterium]|nr:prohibitin family protein [Cyanobacteriota bacterium]MDA1019955.1 prohibitin family protein [Cyanobacteriota bacterium]